MSEPTTPEVEPEPEVEETPAPVDPPTDLDYEDAIKEMVTHLTEFFGINSLHKVNDSEVPFATTVEYSVPGTGELQVRINDSMLLSIEVYRAAE